MPFVFANNASSFLMLPIEAVDTELTVNPDDAALFPEVDTYDEFTLTLTHPTTGEREIVYVTAKADNVFEVTRAQEGTVAQAFPANTVVAHNITAGVLEYLRDL